MEKQLRAWIFCRVALHSPKSLLSFQKNQLESITNTCNMKVIGATQVISEDKRLNKFEMKYLLIKIRKRKFDVLLINSLYRISIYPNIYEEFEMICRLNKVQIVTYTDYINK